MPNSTVAMQSKEKLLTDLRKELGISSQEHFMVLEKVMSDKEVEALRENRPPEGQAQPDAGLGKKRKDSAPLSGVRCDSMTGQMHCHMHCHTRSMVDETGACIGHSTACLHYPLGGPSRRNSLKCR